MSITEQFKKIEEQYLKPIGTATTQTRKAAERAKKAYSELESARTRVFGLNVEKYKEKLAAATEIIETEVNTIQCPDKYDQARVDELRKVLAVASLNDPERNLAVLKALRELQLIVTKWPFINRVAKLLNEWTGRKYDIEINEGTNKKTYASYLVDNRGSKLMMFGNYRYEYVKPGAASYNRTFSYANFRTRVCSDHVMISGVPVRFVEFWELNCIATKIDPKYLVGEDEPNRNDDHFKERNTVSPRNAYCASLQQMGKLDSIPMWHSDSILQFNISDADIATYLMTQHLNIFTFADIIKNFFRFNERCQKYILDEMNRQVKMMERCLFNSCKNIKLDRDKMEVSWTDAVDEKMMFDPDTCEMVHTSLDVHTMSVARAHIDSLCEYVANHKPDVVTKYGRVTLTLRYSGGWSNDTEHLCDKKLKSIAKDFLPKSLSKLIDIVPPNLDLVGKSLCLHDDRKYPCYDFTALLKVPISEFYAKFKRFSNNETQYYPKFKIVDTELKKIYFDKEDLNES